MTITVIFYPDYYYIKPGETVTYTCDSVITKNTKNTVTSNVFDMYDNLITAQATAQVNVTEVTGAVKCDTLISSSDSGTDKAGQIATLAVPGSTSSPIAHTIPNYYSYFGGAAGVAVNPLSPELIYYFQRNYDTGVYGGLYVYNSVTGEDKWLTTAQSPNPTVVVRMGFDGRGILWAIDVDGTLWSWTPAEGWKTGERWTFPHQI